MNDAKREFFMERGDGVSRSRGTCEWCGEKGAVFARFNMAHYAHALCAECQHKRVKQIMKKYSKVA